MTFRELMDIRHYLVSAANRLLDIGKAVPELRESCLGQFDKDMDAWRVVKDYMHFQEC